MTVRELFVWKLLGETSDFRVSLQCRKREVVGTIRKET